MTYALSAALPSAVYARLTDQITDTPVYDALPTGTLPALYITLGPEVVRDRSDQTGHGADHDFSVTIATETAGFAAAKLAAAQVSDALLDTVLTLTRGRIVSLNFLRATASRVDGSSVRQITLIFRARVEDL